MSARTTRTRWLLAIAAIVAVLLFVWLARSSEPHADAASAVARSTDERAQREQPAPAEPAPVAARDEAPAPSEAQDAPTPEPAKTGAAEPKPDLAAREWITFHVENAQGYPVAGAEIELTGLRTQRAPGGHHMWRGDPSLGKTAADGTLKLAYPVWVDLDDQTGQISFSVKHPDYATYENFGRRVEPEIRVVLALGSVLVVSGWIGEPSHVITDVTAAFSWNVDVKPDDWLPRRDGRKTTTRVPQGTHLIYLEYDSKELGQLFSDMTTFTLEAGETKELHLELKPAKRVMGRLDDVVPRPIVDGRVVLVAQLRTPDYGDALLRTFDMPINSDGTFSIDGVMAGDGQVIALCKGWASKLQPMARDGSNDAEPGDKTVLVAQIVELRGELDELVVAMEPTAALEVELRAPDGSPAAGATVEVWPNACFLAGACSMFLAGRQWSAVTDEHGLARVEQLPAGSHSFGVSHAAYDLPIWPPGAPGGTRHRDAKFVAGETTRVSYDVEYRVR